jgi:hypothetical protein
MTEPFYPRVPRFAIQAGDVEPFNATYNAMDPNRSVVIGSKRLLACARTILSHVGEEVTLLDALRVTGRVGSLESNVLEVTGFELIHTEDAKHRRYEVE